MKRFIPVLALLIACILTASVASQERSLFKHTDPRDLIKPKVAAEPKSDPHRSIPIRREPATKKNTPNANAMASRKKAAVEWVKKRCVSTDWNVSEWEFDGTYSGPVSQGKTWDAFTMRFSREVEFGMLSYRGSLLFYFEKDELQFPRNDWPIDQPPPGAFLIQVGDSVYESLKPDTGKPLAEPRR